LLTKQLANKRKKGKQKKKKEKKKKKKKKKKKWWFSLNLRERRSSSWRWETVQNEMPNDLVSFVGEEGRFKATQGGMKGGYKGQIGVGIGGGGNGTLKRSQRQKKGALQKTFPE